MGAAGYVVVFDEAKVRATYAEMFPEHDIDRDWWYLQTITAELDGKKWIFNYSDDQGYHEGIGNEFWFGHYPLEGEDESARIPAKEAQDRCLKAVYASKSVASVEVWT